MVNDNIINLYKRPEAVQMVIALFVLCIGGLVYLLDRQPGSIYFIPEWLSLTDKPGSIFGQLGNYLPTFIHVYVFILLTAAISSFPALPICIAWLVIDSLFELAQFTPVAKWITENTPNWFAGIPFLENTGNYFLFGTFDVSDMFSIFVGAVAAYLTIKLSRGEA